MKIVTDLAEYFGKPPHKVNQLALRVAIYYDYPEWLRGVTKMEEFPRFTRQKLGNVVNPPTLRLERKNATSINALAERIKWIVEELHGEWSLCEEGFSFSDNAEAIYFKLRWF